MLGLVDTVRLGAEGEGHSVDVIGVTLEGAGARTILDVPPMAWPRGPKSV